MITTEMKSIKLNYARIEIKDKGIYLEFKKLALDKAYHKAWFASAHVPK